MSEKRSFSFRPVSLAEGRLQGPLRRAEGSQSGPVEQKPPKTDAFAAVFKPVLQGNFLHRDSHRRAWPYELGYTHPPKPKKTRKFTDMKQ